MGPDGVRAAALGIGWAGELSDVQLALAEEVTTADHPETADLKTRRDADLDALMRPDQTVKAAMRELRRTLPAMARYTPDQLDQTLTDLGQLLDAAAAALTGDPRCSRISSTGPTMR